MTGHFGEKWSRNRAGLERLCKNHEISGGEQYSGNFIDSLIAHRAIYEQDTAAWEIFLPEGKQFIGTRRIMGAIKIHDRLFLEAFEPARPPGCAYALLNHFIHDLESALR